MIQSYIRTSIRNLKRNPLISVINLFGLSLGLTSCLVAGLYIKHELTANSFHKDLHSIYRVTASIHGGFNINGTPYRFAEASEKDIPGVTASLRLFSEGESSVKINTQIFKHHNIVYADPAFFSFFTFPLKFGNAKQALAGLKQVVLSDEISKKYFGDQNPQGQTIQILLNDEYVDLEVTGVALPPPTYSSIQFDFLIPLENRFLRDPKSKDIWSSFFLTTFLKIDPEKLASVKEAFPALVRTYLRDEKKADGTPAMSFVLNPLADHHLSEGFSGSGIKEGTSAKLLYVFAGIAAIILVLACFNFMNLTNAQSSRRAVEVGIRKVVGAMKAQLIRQFLMEAIFLSILAAVLALGLAELSLLIFRDLLEVQLTVFNLEHLDVYAGLAVVTLFAGIMAGVYPALILSNLSVLNTFKRYFRIGGGNFVTRSVLTIQFGLSIMLIVCAIVMWKQQIYMINKDLGFNKEQVLVIPFANRDTASVDYLKTEIKKLSETINVTRTTTDFNHGNSASIQTMPDNSRMMIYTISADEDYIPTMEMEMVKGRAFSQEDEQAGDVVMINETLMKTLHIEDSIGMKLGRTVGWVNKPVVVGVVKDFHNTQLKWEIGSVMFLNNTPLNSEYLMVRLAPGNLVLGKDKIQGLWEKVNADSPFEFFFLDDEINKQYAAELRWSNIITLATGMAIFLSMLGLLGLAMYTAEQRRKEIGIRKILGASVQQLVTLLSRGYLWLIVIAFAVTVPLSYYLMTNYWLSNFAYRTPIDVVVYLLSLLIVMLIAGLAVGSQTIRAAMQNPADTLKEE
jgi:putative ABC transport system permease protein